MTVIDELRELGYSVEAAQQINNDALPTVYFVEGLGVGLYVPENDDAAWASLVDHHAARAEVMERSETGERVAIDADGSVIELPAAEG